MSPSTCDVAVFWDIENFGGNIKDSFGSRARKIIAFLHAYLAAEELRIHPRYAFVFAHERTLKPESCDIFAEEGFAVHLTSKQKKNAADGLLLRTVGRLLKEDPKIEPLPRIVILITCDHDLMHAIRTLQNKGRTVWLAGPEGRTSQRLLAYADRFIPLEI